MIRNAVLRRTRLAIQQAIWFGGSRQRSDRQPARRARRSLELTQLEERLLFSAAPAAAVAVEADVTDIQADGADGSEFLAMEWEAD